MAANQEVSELVREAREDAAGTHEPLFTDTRKVCEHGTALYINPTDFGTKTMNFEKGDDVQVDVYPDRIEVRPASSDADGADD